MEKEIINRVEQSGLKEFNLEDYYPKGERALIDMKNYLFQGLILREKDFREQIKNEDWSKYRDKFVALDCTADAIVPTWAYMLIATSLSPYAKEVVFGDLALLETILFQKALAKLDLNAFKDERVIVKGCSRLPVPESAFVELTKLLSPVAKSIMYGEACSTVPIFKKKG